jgi:hypothetical protein
VRPPLPGASTGCRGRSSGSNAMSALRETLALFVRFWLTVTPPLPPEAQAAAQLKGRQRHEGFVEALGRRLQRGQSLLHEIPEDVDHHASPDADALEVRGSGCPSLWDIALETHAKAAHAQRPT